VYQKNSGEVLPKFYLGSERSIETDLIYTAAGGIRTYPHLLDGRNAEQMQLLVILLAYICICQRMENSDWIYMGHASVTPEWMTKTNAFLEHAFGEVAKGSMKGPKCLEEANILNKNSTKILEQRISITNGVYAVCSSSTC
jgi:hypothetical protein